MSRVGWLDASSGASGDMLLGALIGAGVPLPALQAAIDSVSPEPVTLRAEDVSRHGFAATRCQVWAPDTATHRAWADIEPLLSGHERARRTFSRLAEAEARVHGTSPGAVHFHEVGALDAIADVVGVCAGLDRLGLDHLIVSPVAVGGGEVSGSHGRISVPVPAVVELLRGFPSHGGPIDLELCTPTGAALLSANATGSGAQPAMTVERIGVGAGGHDPAGHANVLRLLVGEASPAVAGGDADSPLVLETNVDDLDPRLWPGVIATLLEAGASDAWLTPILMKKGRPAYTLSVLVEAERADVVRREVFRHTTAIGLRERAVGKHALDRTITTVEVDGHRIDVKLASLDGETLNAQPEFEQVRAAADALGQPVKTVLQRAIAATLG